MNAVYNFMDSLIPVIAIVPPTVAFLLFATVLFLKYKKKKDRTTMYFMLAFLSVGFGYGAWATRTIFYPPDMFGPELFFWHKMAYLFSMAIWVFLGLAALEFLKPGIIRKIRNLLLFVTPMIFVWIWMLFSVPVCSIIVAGQTDCLLAAPLSTAAGTLAVLYFIIPNYVFIWFLVKNPGHRLYNRVMLMEMGLILLTLAILVEGLKIGMGATESWGLFVRWFTALGAFIMMYAYTKK